MTGVSLSRWTMSYFAASLLALVAAELMMTLGYGFPNAPLKSPDTLVLVHVVALGWLSLLMCGALFQFVPVLVAKPLFSNTLPLPTLICLIGGIAALLLGFLTLAGRVQPVLPYFLLASALLGAGFALVLWNLGRTLWAARPLPLPARFVVIGLCSVTVAATLGIIFALVLGGATTYPPFLAIAAEGVSIHAIAGFGGWLTFTAMGVSYRLLAMFMLAPELDSPSTRAALGLGAAGLTIAIVGGVAAIWWEGQPDTALLVAGLIAVAALALYGRDMLHLYRARKRRDIELNSRMAALSLASLAASVVLMAVLLALGRLSDYIAPLVFLVAFGWLSGLGLAKLYKIVAFLTWLECYGPVLGRASTPRVQDLVIEQRAIKWFLIYFLAVWSGTAALLLEHTFAFRFAAAVMLVATSGIVVQLLRTRRLLNVGAEQRLPAGASRPRLLMSVARQS